MRHLRGINENYKLEESIDTLNDISDVFNTLDDDWGLKVGGYFLKKEPFPDLGYFITKKWDVSGKLVLSTNNPISGIYTTIEDSFWLVRSEGVIDVDNILEIYNQCIDLISRCERMLGLDNLSTRSTIGFIGVDRTISTNPKWRSFFFDKIEDEHLELEKFIENLISSEIKKQKVDISIQFRK